jgi:hypothetical protein
MLSAPAIQFKGSGWYVTDYAHKTSPSTSAQAKPGNGGSGNGSGNGPGNGSGNGSGDSSPSNGSNAKTETSADKK